MFSQKKSTERDAESWLRAIAALASPTLLGAFVIVCVVTGEALGDLVAGSELVGSVALVVGAALILGSAAIYVRAPEEYRDLQRTNTDQLQALVEQADALRSLAAQLKDGSAGERDTRGADTP